MRLGRYPFNAGIKHYLERKQGTWDDETTAPQREGALKHIGDILEELKDKGKVTTTDPRHMTSQDVLNFAAHIKKKMNPSSQNRLLQLLKDYMRFFKNHVFDEMLVSGEFKMPKASRTPVKYIEPDDLQTIFETVNRMEGWHGAMSRGMVALYFGTGARPSELRVAEYRDLDLKKNRLYIRHPKGEGSWATPDWVDIIRGDVLPLVHRYVEERSDYLSENGKEAVHLFPNIYTEKGYYSENAFRSIKSEIANESGVDFSLKMFRSTLCTLTVNSDLSRLPAMTVQLRHADPGTTSQYYWNIERSAAGRQLADAWRETSMKPVSGPSYLAPISAKKGVIDSKFEVTGYV